MRGIRRESCSAIYHSREEVVGDHVLQDRLSQLGEPSSLRSQHGSHQQGKEANHGKANEEAFHPVHDDPSSGIAP